MGLFDKFKKSKVETEKPGPGPEIVHPPKLLECWEKQGQYSQKMQDASENRAKFLKQEKPDRKKAKECELEVEKYKSLLHDEQVKENKLRE